MLYSIVSSTALLLVIFIVNLTSYNEHYLERLQKYERAQIYLKQDVCRNDAIKAQLGDYTNCERSRRIVDQSVRWLAITDCARDVLKWMGLTGTHLTDTNAFKMGLLAIVIFVMATWLGLLRVGANREIHYAMQPVLPTTKHKIA